MGNILSVSSGRNNIANLNEISNSETMGDLRDEDENVDEQFHDSIEDDEEARVNRRQEKLNEFKKQLDLKREQRKIILARHRNQKKNLEESLKSEMKSKLELYYNNKALRELLVKHNIEIPENLQSSSEDKDFVKTICQMGDEIDILKSNNNELRMGLATSNRALQEAYSDMGDLSAQNTESIKQISALKEVVAVSKTMISLRENQLNELKNKLGEIEQSLADREANMLSTNLRQEYERQLQNIKTLRALYEERARLADVTKQALVRELEEHKILLQAETKKNEQLQNKVDDQEIKINNLEDTVDDKINVISTCQKESLGLKSEMAVVNKLFSQVLMGYKSKNYLDNLVLRLEENHGLLTHMAEKENGSETSTALPKLLLDLINQMDDSENCDIIKSQDKLDLTDDSEYEVPSSSKTSAEEIVQNLPKVWRVLMELLSHQSEADANTEKVTTCYKSVNTKSGPVLVPSVSQTYIRLKDLILEKLTLIKEVNKMKQLNTHLETRLGAQERRLCLVTTELTKTWHVVGRLRRHYQQLHTHEKILKYELQQKRKFLNGLKEELEYCREKCDQAREKNSQSEKDWKTLRNEFSNRKLKIDSTSLNNSAESGYSDERVSDESSESNDESEYVIKPQIKSKKKINKSFEIVLDSSTDFNLVAEREDPESDLLDIAELPLDTQNENADTLDMSNSCNSENKIVETEDECADIRNDSCIDDLSYAEGSSEFYKKSTDLQESLNIKNLNTSSHSSNSQAKIDPATILRDIQKQNERLAQRDKKLDLLEKNSTALLKKTQEITSISNTLNNTLDNLINRPTSSRLITNVNFTESQDDDQNFLAQVGDQVANGLCEQTELGAQDISSENNLHSIDEIENSASLTVLKSIPENKVLLEDVDKQNKEKNNFIKNENELLSCEPSCSKTKPYNVDVTENTAEKLNMSDSNIMNDSVELETDQNDINLLIDAKTEFDQPSSSDMSHEARFAARDLRFKRLEEQTKSLVNKVNKTATKGVKINYKLEELHNIYGSENSRSGTPSEENEEVSQNTDEE